jgi:hypothetical protein
MAEADLEQIADEELQAALTLSWKQLSPLTPWGDVYDGVTAGGLSVKVERNYIWQDEPGGTICCEIAVYYHASRYDQGARRTARIEAPAAG